MRLYVCVIVLVHLMEQLFVYFRFYVCVLQFYGDSRCLPDRTNSIAYRLVLHCVNIEYTVLQPQKANWFGKNF